jgi:hypothetical protein
MAKLFLLYSLLALNLSAFAATNLGTLTFTSNQCALNAEALTMCQRIYRQQQHLSSIQLVVRAYTDSTGDVSYNETLSQRRAEAVAQALVAMGVPRNAILRYGMGEAHDPSHLLIEEGRLATVQMVHTPDVLPKLDVAAKYFTIDAGRDTVLQLAQRGVSIKLLANSFVDDKGNAIRGLVQLSWTEWTTNAQIALANINMFHDHEGERYRFNSSGMFAIGGYQNGREIFLAPGAAMGLRYKLTQNVDSTNFYAFNDNTGVWQYQFPIQARGGSQWYGSGRSTKAIGSENDSILIVYKSATAAAINAADRQRFFKGEKELKDVYTDAEIMSINGMPHPDAAKYSSTGAYSGAINLSDYLAGKRVADDDREALAAYALEPTTVYATQNKGYTMAVDDVVQNLNLTKFGSYNCDQMYRMKMPVFVDAIYADEKGVLIEAPYFFDVMDLDKVGGFSFDATHFAFDSGARNALLMISEVGEIYVCTHKQFMARKKQTNGSYCFQVTKVSNRVKKGEDVQKLLMM